MYTKRVSQNEKRYYIEMRETANTNIKSLVYEKVLHMINSSDPLSHAMSVCRRSSHKNWGLTNASLWTCIYLSTFVQDKYFGVIPAGLPACRRLSSELDCWRVPRREAPERSSPRFGSSRQWPGKTFLVRRVPMLSYRQSPMIWSRCTIREWLREGSGSGSSLCHLTWSPSSSFEMARRIGKSWDSFSVMGRIDPWLLAPPALGSFSSIVAVAPSVMWPQPGHASQVMLIQTSCIIYVSARTFLRNLRTVRLEGN